MEITEDLLELFEKIRNDPWEFLKIVRTKDEVDRFRPIKPFPCDKEYLKYYTRIWERENKLAVPKTRRMLMSWTNLALFTWDALFHQNRSFAFVSKKEEDAAELVERAKFIIDNLDTSILPKELIPKYEHTFGRLRFPEIDSQIRGYPQGADQLRQFTFSGLLMDECAFWEDAEKAYSASLPTIDGGGKIVMISSPAPSFFQKIVFDQLDQAANDFSTDVTAKTFHPMEGIRFWKNLKNRFLVFEIHYRADPAKRSEEFKAEKKASLPYRQYLLEYELHWESFSGLPVYGDTWNNEAHILKEKFTPHLGLPLLIGFDFGLTPAAIICQKVNTRLFAFKEFVAVNMGFSRFLPLIMQELALLYPPWRDYAKDWIAFIDPSGAFRKDTDEGTCAKILDEKGFKKIVPGPIAFEERRKSVETFLMKMEGGKPCFQISEEGCPMLLKGFRGGYMFPDGQDEIEPTKLRPLKNEFSHPHDALQMITAEILKMTRKMQVNIPKPSYIGTKS